MSVKDTNESIIASIVASYAARPDVTPDDIVDLTRKLRAELVGGSAGAAARPPAAATTRAGTVPALPLSEAVTRDKVYCLCCGRGFKMLKRHLGSEHGLSEAQYRRMFDLPEDMPLVAPSYSERKADYAKQAGLGKHERSSVAGDASSESDEQISS
ncbi:Ros/MucR family transcriptional regulator [Roseivivax sp. CAU 1761]